MTTPDPLLITNRRRHALSDLIDLLPDLAICLTHAPLQPHTYYIRFQRFFDAVAAELARIGEEET